MWAVLLAAAGCAGGILLGNWQLRRADETRALLAAEAAPEPLRGRFLEKNMMYLANRFREGRAGYEVLQALVLADGRNVLVERGWVAAPPGAGAPPPVPTPAGEVELRGVRRERVERVYAAPGAGNRGRVRENVSLAEFAAWSGLALEPYVIEQHSPLSDGLQRDWPHHGIGVAGHQSYALQWYSLAALSIVLLVALNLKHARP